MANEFSNGDAGLARAIAREVARRGGSTYFVGGCVRDACLGIPSKDIDIEVHGLPVDDLRALLAQFGEVTTVGASFGVFNLKGHTLDIAVPRSKGAGQRGGKDALREVADPFVGTFEAARRRDLTMNALYEDVLTGDLLDYFDGRAAIEARIVRHVDDDTFSEDPLRVLRVAQFAARFGMSVDPRTTALCARLDLSDVPSERVLEELRKALLKAERPARFFEELRAMHQLSPWFAEVEALIDVPQNPLYHPEGDVWAHTMLVLDAAAELRGQADEPFGLMLAALCHDLGKPTTTEELDGRVISHGHETAGVPLAEALLGRLGASVKLQGYVQNMVELHMAPNSMVAQRAKRKAFNRLFDRSTCPGDLLLLARADDRGRGDHVEDVALSNELAERLAAFEELMARPHVQGRDLLELGIEPGPAMGEVLRYAHKLRLAGLSKENQVRQCVGYWHGMQRAKKGGGLE